MIYRTFIIAVLLVITHGCSDSNNDKAVQIVFDTDADFDDLVALTLMEAKGVLLTGIAVEQSGWGLPNLGAAHVAKVLRTVGDKCVTIRQGGERISQNAPINFTKFRAFQEGVNADIETGLDDRTACPVAAESEDPIGDMVDPLIDTVIIATGPLTNVARFLENDPAVSMIIFDGQTPGTEHGLEFPSNNQLDADAAAAVFASGVPILFVDDAFIHQTALAIDVIAAFNTPLSTSATLVTDLVNAVVQGEGGAQGLYIWDAVTAAVYIDEAGIVETSTKGNLSINAEGEGEAYGQTLSSPGKDDRIPTKPVSDAFKNILVDAFE